MSASVNLRDFEQAVFAILSFTLCCSHDPDTDTTCAVLRKKEVRSSNTRRMLGLVDHFRTLKSKFRSRVVLHSCKCTGCVGSHDDIIDLVRSRGQGTLTAHIKALKFGDLPSDWSQPFPNSGLLSTLATRGGAFDPTLINDSQRSFDDHCGSVRRKEHDQVFLTDIIATLPKSAPDYLMNNVNTESDDVCEL
ncbi:hypothetical protein FVE85_5166 [Porphyridium purpureum]|uniref:Uncharacterized protein n=1 Tax=Porphyridium purpureum TaxID=35688 RepID=A0A5J4Z124_PORPP|nr:hypothetical protein FVE85_5166 [Porphyridium purpureum]|eukprot:POR2882..scf295_1